MDLEQMMSALNPDIIERFKTSIETGRWPDGRPMTAEQKEICIQAVIAFEHRHVAPEDRTGYVPPKSTPCGPDSDTQEDKETPVKWQK